MPFILENIDKHISKRISNSGEAWFYDDKLHRIDGPAVTQFILISNDEVGDECEWWFHGTKIDCSSQEEFEKLIKLKAFW